MLFPVLMTWQITISVMKYYTYPVKTQMLYQKAGEIVFPAVTICNLNPLRQSVLSEAGDMLDTFKKVWFVSGVGPKLIPEISHEASARFQTEVKRRTSPPNV